MKRIALALVLLAAPAVAQDSVPETVTVTGTSSLAGIWKIRFPYGISLTIPGVFSGTRPAQEAFCRIGDGRDTLSIACLPWKGPGTANLEKGHLRLAFCCAAVFRYAIDAPIVTATAFTGVYKLSVFGDSHEAKQPASGRKLMPSTGTSDAAGQGATLRTELEAIASGTTPPPDLPTRKKFGPEFGGPPAMSAASLRELGPVEQILYLGASTPYEIPPGSRPPARQAEPYQSYALYDVAFAKGHRLCGVLAGESGKVDVLCV